jgi:hypothetical protein
MTDDKVDKEGQERKRGGRSGNIATHLRSSVLLLVTYCHVSFEQKKGVGECIKFALQQAYSQLRDLGIQLKRNEFPDCHIRILSQINLL